MARVGLVLKNFSALCLAVLITLCIFHGVLSKVSRVSKVSNKEISGVSLSEKVAVSTVIFSKNSSTRLNFISEYPTQDISSTNHLAWRLKDYQPIALLDVKPVVLKNIQASLSAIFNDINSQEISCLLMINEYGDVDKIIFGGEGYPRKKVKDLYYMFSYLKNFCNV
jgi:hypothetical protein